jgi:hypothetical protein
MLSQTTPPLATKSLDIAHLQVIVEIPLVPNTNLLSLIAPWLVTPVWLVTHFLSNGHHTLMPNPTRDSSPPLSPSLFQAGLVPCTRHAMSTKHIHHSTHLHFAHNQVTRSNRNPLPRQTYATHIPNSAPLTLKSTIAPILTSLLHTPPLSVRSPHPTAPN